MQVESFEQSTDSRKRKCHFGSDIKDNIGFDEFETVSVAKSKGTQFEIVGLG